MYGGGYSGMGMGGGQSTQMMSSLSMSSVCMILLAAGGFFALNYMKKQETPAPEPVEIAPEPKNANTAQGTYGSGGNPVSGLDGTFMILVGSLALNVDGDCNSSVVNFRTPKDSKTAWNVRKAGTTSEGHDYYTLQSAFRSFNKTCNKQYLTAPVGCKSGPYLAEAMSTPQQYWLIEGAPGNYTLRSLACKMSRWPLQYLQQSGQLEASKPNFSARIGSSFQFEKPFAG